MTGEEDILLMTKKKQDPSLRLFVVLSKTYRLLMDQVAADIHSKGLNLTDFAVLELLYHKGDQPMQKIGEKILLASGSITYVVDKLEKKGFLSRKQCPQDRRVTFASISEKGKQLLKAIFPEHWRRIEMLTSELDLQEKEQVIELLKKLGMSLERL